MQFGISQAQSARYYYERLLYTGWPFAGTGGASSLNNGTTSLFNAQAWNPVQGFTWQSRLEMLQTTQNSGVNLTWSADGKANVGPGTTSAFAANLRQQRLNVNGVHSLSLSLVNTTGSAVAGWQTNYAVGMKRLTAAEKVLYQRAGRTESEYSLNAAEQAALVALDMLEMTTQNGKRVPVLDQNGNPVVKRSGAAQLKDLIEKGTAPIGIERVMSGLYDNRVLQERDAAYSVAATSADQTFGFSANFDAAHPTQGTILVLTEIAVEGAPNATITVDRDGQPGYMQVNGEAFAQTNDEPWHVWVPATQYLTFHAALGPGGSGSVTTPVRVKILEVEMSDVIAVQFGLVHHANDLSKPDVYYKSLVGLS